MKPDYDPIELYWRDDDPDAHWHEPTPTPRTVKRTVAFLGAVLVLSVVMAFAVGEGR